MTHSSRAHANERQRVSGKMARRCARVHSSYGRGITVCPARPSVRACVRMSIRFDHSCAVRSRAPTHPAKRKKKKARASAPHEHETRNTNTKHETQNTKHKTQSTAHQAFKLQVQHRTPRRNPNPQPHNPKPKPQNSDPATQQPSAQNISKKKKKKKKRESRTHRRRPVRAPSPPRT